jgi:hypothetical protein
MPPPWEVVPVGPRAPTTLVGDVDGAPLGDDADRTKSAHHLSCRHRWCAPWEAMPVGPGVPTTLVGDVDGGSPARLRVSGLHMLSKDKMGPA